jgi:hypothetical protein
MADSLGLFSWLVEWVWRNMCVAVTYMFLTLRGGARRGGVDKMADQIARFPGVSGPLAYSPEALGITRFWRMSSPA